MALCAQSGEKLCADIPGAQLSFRIRFYRDIVSLRAGGSEVRFSGSTETPRP
jgi:hypothetical protein